MRLLVLAGAYHPYYSANGLCVKNVVDECVARGIDVTCVVNAAKGVPGDAMLDGARVVRVRPRAFTRWQQHVSSGHKGRVIDLLDRVVRLFNRGKMLLMSRTWPQVSPICTQRFFDTGRRLHKETPFDIVVAVYTPSDTLMAGYQLKKAYPEVAFIPYYLDALAGGWGPSAWTKEKIETRTRMLELEVDSLADLIVSMGSAERYHEVNPLSGEIQAKRVYLGVPMMKDILMRPAESVGRHRPYVLYAGGIPFPRRDPRPLMELMCAMCERLDFDFVIAGECSDPLVLEPYIKKSGGRIEYAGYQDKESIEKLESGAFALANIGSVNPSTIPCKIFEYMEHLKPVISTFRIEDEPSRPFLMEYGHAYFIDERIPIDGQIDGAVQFLSKYRGASVPAEACEGKFHRNRPEAFADLLMRVHERGL